MPLETGSPQSIDSGLSDSPEALATSARLTDVIVDEIERAGGWIRFSRFMELALYAPGLGYYSAGATKIGRDPGDGSDFVTAPELTPLFGRALARPVAEVLADGGDTVLELGGGSGALAADLLLELEALGRLPASYLLLEISAELRRRQADTLARRAAHLIGRVRWIEMLPPWIDGVVLGNEVLDALPTDLIVRAGTAWSLRGVTRSGRQLRYEDRPLTDDLLEAVGAIPAPETLSDPYVTELSVAAGALVGTLLSRMSDRAVMVLIDYGFPRSEYYHPQRGGGTLMTHRRHRTGGDALAHIGLQDITAHVDFSAVADAARAVGGVAIGYTSQASFLIDCGIADLMSGAASDARQWVPQASSLQKLLSEAEMGELFKVVGFSRRTRTLTGFGGRDRLDRL